MADGRDLPVLLTTAELATMIHVTTRTLEDWRLDKKGPPYFKLGNGKTSRVVYPLKGVMEWLERSRKSG